MAEASIQPAGAPIDDPIQALWIGPALSALEQLSLASFVANGHEVHLYVYEEVAGVPDGVRVLDGRAVLPEDAIFSYGPNAVFGSGSVAAFSNVFRYKLLYDRGGWWVDADMVCLRPFDLEAPYVFGYQYDPALKPEINGAVIRMPGGSDLAKSLFETAQSRGHDVQWNEIGPRLFTEKVNEFQLQAFALPPHAFYPVGAWAVAGCFAEDPDGARAAALEDAYGLHLWNEMLRWGGKDKNAVFPATSIFERLKARYGIAASTND